MGRTGEAQRSLRTVRRPTESVETTGMQRPRGLVMAPARQGAVLLACCGALAITKSSGGLEALAIAAITAAAAGGALVLPWRRRPLRAAVILVLVAAGLIGLAEQHGLIPLRAYGDLFVLLFAWVGATQPPMLSIYLVP